MVKKNKKASRTSIFQVAIVLLLALIVVITAITVRFSSQNQDNRVDASSRKLTFEQTNATTWHHVDRVGTYDYSATAFIRDDNWHIWTCGGKLRVEVGSDGVRREIPIAGDWIYYTKLDSTGNLGTNLVMSPSRNQASMDSLYTCAPTVVELDHSYLRTVLGGDQLYMMHYECSPRFNGADSVFTEICLAFSTDGQRWGKFNRQLWEEKSQFDFTDNAIATPVLTASSARNGCGYSFNRSMHGASNSDCDDYGVGHPSTVLIDTNGPQVMDGEQVWMWYYDSGATWDDRGVSLIKSWDGFNFETPIKTNLKNPVDVKRVQVEGFANSYFVATMALFGRNYYAYSTDGINWTTPDFHSQTDTLRLGKGIVLESECTAPAQPAIIGNSKGTVTSSFINILSGEGFYGKQDGKKSGDTCYSPAEDVARGSTWGIRLLQGRLIEEQATR